MISLFNASVYDWGLQVIHAIQTLESSFFTYLMLFVSFLSDTLTYLIFLPILFWCLDEKKAFKVSLFVLFSASINTSIKDFLQVPRPYIVDPSVAIDTHSGFSTPSGHSQNSAAFWPYAVFLFLKNGKTSFVFKVILSVGLPLIIGFSRVYLGVHYPSDVLLGWTIGFLLSIGAILFTPVLEKKIANLPRAFKIVLVGFTAFGLNWIGPTDTSMSAAFFGLGIGYIYLTEKGGYDAKQGTRVQKLLRILVGLCIIGLLYGGLKLVLPEEGESNYQLFRFIRYLSVGFSASYIIPKLFIALKIAKQKEVE